ncbi:hypothetical protein JYG30_19785 [Fibrella sp. USSR17]
MDYSTLEQTIRRVNLPFLESIGFKVCKESKGNIELETQQTFIRIRFHYSLPGLEVYFGTKESSEDELSFNDIHHLLGLSISSKSTEAYLDQINSIINENKTLLVDNQDFYKQSLKWKDKQNEAYNFTMQMSFALNKADAYWQKGDYALFVNELLPYKPALSNSYLKKIVMAEKRLV